MKGSLQRKLLYNYVIVVLLVLVGVSVGISILLREYFIANKAGELAAKGYELSYMIESYAEGRIDHSQLTRFLDSADNFLDARVWIVDGKHRLVAVSTPDCAGMGHGPGMGMKGPQMIGGLPQPLDQLLEPVFSGQVVTRTLSHPFYEEDMLIVAIPLKKDGGTITGAVVLNSPIQGIDGFLKRIYYYIGGIGLLALLVTILVARGLARSITSPLSAMQESAAAMARGDYDSRVPIQTADEVGDLGRSLNALAQELSRFVSHTAKMEKLRRDFIANVSHELRTPLTLIRGYTEALLDGTATEADQAEQYHRLVRDETIRLERLIRELLDLSRLQSDGGEPVMEKLPLAEVTDSVVSLLKPRAEQKGIALTLDVRSDRTDIRGNGDRLTQLMLILLDNALKFTPPGGKVEVSVERDGEQIVLTVRDTGMGISSDDLPYIWERFYKADKSHTRSETGAGLGLAIAKEIMDRHGAKVQVSSVLKEGTVFQLRFTAA